MAGQPLSRGAGSDVKRVVVDEIIWDKGIALCKDDHGTVVQVPTALRRGGGGWAQVGQVWLIDRQYGQWSFSALASDHAPPVITAVRTGESALTLQLLDALLAAGLAREPDPEQQFLD